MAETYLITGANRGIGLALTKILLEQGDRVFAACREPARAAELSGLRRDFPRALEPVVLSVESEGSPERAAAEVGARTDHLDVLINNAGISPAPFDATLETVGMDRMRQAFEVNALGPLQVSRAFLPLLRKSARPRILNMTSGLASLSGKNSAGFYAYGVSKAALNMLTRTMAFDLKKDGVVCVCLDPGWVQTDMGGPSAPLKPQESAAAIVKTVKGLAAEKTSLFLYNDGAELKW
jgi:NAD(P)-dependent dehydrogenase (short-subunit alcohol dehydrogenase family)